MTGGRRLGGAAVLLVVEGVALSALAVPLLLALANLLYVGVLGNQPAPADASGLGQSIFS